MMTKLLSEGIGNSMKDSKYLFASIGITYVKKFITKCFEKDHDLLGGIKMLKLEQLQKMANLLFKPIKMISSVDYEEFFNFLRPIS